MLTNNAFANVGVFSPQQRITGALWPQASTTIEVEKEALTLDFQTEKRLLDIVDVEANYSLFNNSELPENITAGFPVPYYVTSADIILGDKASDYTVSEIDLEGLSDIDEENRNWLKETMVWRDPITTETYAEHEIEMWQKVNIVIFDISLKPMEKVDLKVRYDHPLSFDRYKYVNEIYHFDYLLEPASFWADFGSLTVKFHVPHNWEFASNMEVEKLEGSNNVYEVYYQGLPENMLNISLMSKDGFWFGHGTVIGVWVMAIIAILSISFLGGLKSDNLYVKMITILIIAIIAIKLFLTFRFTSNNLLTLIIIIFLLALSVRLYERAAKRI